MKNWALLVLIANVASLASGAQAQIVPTTTDPTYIAVTSNTPVSGGQICGIAAPSYCIGPQQGIPLSYYATSAGVATLLNNDLNAVNTQFSKAYQGIAISSAMGDAIPNPGDRFAVRVNTAGFSEQAAGAISFSYSFADNARVSVNYGQARSQTIISGGLTFSFQ